MVIRRLIDYAIRTTGAKLIPAGYRAFRKYDIQTTNALFGKSGGKGFRHGRDLGLILGEYVGDDDLEDATVSPGSRSSSRPKYKTYRGYKRRDNRRCRCNNRRYQTRR